MSKKNGRTKKRPKKRQEKNANFWKTKKKTPKLKTPRKKRQFLENEKKTPKLKTPIFKNAQKNAPPPLTPNFGGGGRSTWSKCAAHLLLSMKYYTKKNKIIQRT